MKEVDFDAVINRVIEEWKTKKDQTALTIPLSLDEQIEVLKLIKKMRE